MADKKISALPAASTPLAGSEVLPIVQGGTTDQVSVANLTAGRAVSALSLATPDTDAATSITASGLTIGRGAAFAGGQTELFTVGTRRLGFGTTGAASVYLYSASTEAVAIDTSQNVKATSGNFVVGTAGKGIDFSANTNAPGMTSELLTWYEEGTWTPSVAAGSGTITTVGTVIGNYTRIGRLVTLCASVAITDNGTGSGSIRITGFPFAASANLPEYVGTGSNASTAKVLNVVLNGSQIYVFYYDATYPVTSGQALTISLTYQV